MRGDGAGWRVVVSEKPADRAGQPKPGPASVGALPDSLHVRRRDLRRGLRDYRPRRAGPELRAAVYQHQTTASYE